MPMNRYEREADVADHAGHHGVDELPRAEPAAQVRAGRAGREDGVEAPPGRVLEQRHGGDEDGGGGGRDDEVRDVEQWSGHECVLLWIDPTEPGTLSQWLERQ